MATFVSIMWWVGALADALAVGAALFAIYALIFKRKELAVIFNILASAHLIQRSNKVRDIVSKINGLNYNEKTKKAEVKALVGQLAGEVAAMLDEFPELAAIDVELRDYMANWAKFSEPRKHKLTAHIVGILETSVYRSHKTAAGNGK